MTTSYISNWFDCGFTRENVCMMLARDFLKTRKPLPLRYTNSAYHDFFLILMDLVLQTLIKDAFGRDHMLTSD